MIVCSDDDNGMHSIGCAGIVVQVTGTNWPRPSYTLLVTGLCRFKLDTIVLESPYLVGLVQQLDKLPVHDIGLISLTLPLVLGFNYILDLIRNK